MSVNQLQVALINLELPICIHPSDLSAEAPALTSLPLWWDIKCLERGAILALRRMMGAQDVGDVN